jgi:flagellar export protein FliJ
MTFKYKFESIKKIKESLEKKAQKELAEVDLLIEHTKLEILTLDNILKALKVKLGEHKSIKAAEMHHINRYEDYLAAERRVLENKLDELETLRTQKLENLQTKQKEFKMFETMEEKHHTAFVLDANRVEQITIDEIANQKFVRSKL